MNLKNLLENVKSGAVSVDCAVERLKTLPYDDLDFAKIDCHRKLRKGCGEVVYGAGKTIPQLEKIIATFVKNNENVLITRAKKEQFDALKTAYPDLTFDETSKIMTLILYETQKTGLIAVCAAGTSDLPVAEEAALTAEFFGANVLRCYDVGVAGIHRLFSKLPDIQKANAVIAVAGMEGALASVITGLVAVPVIGVPTSVGYGASFGGIAALLSMLNACAEGMSVVNIDNGFGAGYAACQINRLAGGKK